MCLREHRIKQDHRSRGLVWPTEKCSLGNTHCNLETLQSDHRGHESIPARAWRVSLVRFTKPCPSFCVQLFNCLVTIVAEEDEDVVCSIIPRDIAYQTSCSDASTAFTSVSKGKVRVSMGEVHAKSITAPYFEISRQARRHGGVVGFLLFLKAQIVDR